MTPAHTEQCDDIRDVVKRVAVVETNEARTHDWVQDLATEVKGLREDMHEQATAMRDSISEVKQTIAKWTGGAILLGWILSAAIAAFGK